MSDRDRMKDFLPQGGKMSGKNEIVLNLRVLGYLEGSGKWAAHCLETDLVGYGKTFEKAIEELRELTEMQVSFAIYIKQPSLLDHPAPPELFEMYTNLLRATLQTYTVKRKADKKRRVGSIPLPWNVDKASTVFVQA